MNLTEMLTGQGHDIVSEAAEAMSRAHLKHYEQIADPRDNLKILYELTVECVTTKHLAPITAHAEKIAKERYNAGFDLQEVQMAINVLEEAIWKHIIKEIAPSELAQALGLVSTVVGASKDTLARTYVSLASKTKSPSLNLKAMFKGSEGF